MPSPPTPKEVIVKVEKDESVKAMPVTGAIGSPHPSGESVAVHLFSEYVTIATSTKHTVGEGGVVDMSKGTEEKDSFVTRTESHFFRFDATKTNISKAVFDPIVTVSKEGDKLICELRNPIPGTEIYYTIDNTYPVQFGQKYNGPFEIPFGNLSLRTQTFRNSLPLGRELLIHRNELDKRAN